MSRKYKIRDQDKLYFVTFTVIHWLDVFIRREYKDIFLESLRYCQENKGLELYAFVIMSSHVHMIIGRNSDSSVEAIIRDIKKYTASKIIGAIKKNQRESRRDWLLGFFQRAGMNNSHNTHYQFWQQHSHPIGLSTNAMIGRRLDYIHNNPVTAGIVLSPEDYLYSSAVNYVGFGKKVIDVILI
jgi:REP element-mobilizing transposase RayT